MTAAARRQPMLTAMLHVDAVEGMVAWEGAGGGGVVARQGSLTDTLIGHEGC